MIKLNNLSKYYHNEGIVTQALHKINLEFKLGEFVAITGESGSGKSTLLNVIAGIDSYEEGELYINGEETSYFDDEDWEGYRRDKIAFIFQNYNLIDSYTVLKNVEAALVIQGISKNERIRKAKEIIKKVGLENHLKHRASKLSGGQKQRLAIARALAKETNIIVADEPTGNLDSDSGRQVLELLNEIAKDKLVFIVTHNFEQSAPYVTRKVRLFDGEVVEDKYLKDFKELKVIENEVKETSELKQALTLAKFNFFGQPKKSIFMFFVTLAVVTFIFIFYAGIKVSVSSGYYYSNLNSYPERLIVTKKDRSSFTEEDFKFLSEDNRIDKLVKEDFIIDGSLNMSYDDNFYFNGNRLFNVETNKDSLIGRMPENEGEILLNMYYSDMDRDVIERLIDKEVTFYYHNYTATSHYERQVILKVVGVNQLVGASNYGYYVTDETFKYMYDTLVLNVGNGNVYIVTKDDDYLEYYKVLVSVSQELTGKDVILYNMVLDYDKVYFNNVEVNVSKSLNEHNKPISIELSQEFYDEIFPNEVTQVTINLKNVADRVAVEKHLYNNGYYTLSPYYDFRSLNLSGVIDTFSAIMNSISVIFVITIIYLLSYLIFKLIMNTKIKDYTILRVIGARKSLISNTIRFEILIAFIISYILFFGVYLFLREYPPFTEISKLRTLDYIIIFLVNIGLSLLIARRFIVKQANKTLYTTLRAE